MDEGQNLQSLKRHILLSLALDIDHLAAHEAKGPHALAAASDDVQRLRTNAPVVTSLPRKLSQRATEIQRKKGTLFNPNVNGWVPGPTFSGGTFLVYLAMYSKA